ncbi:hypothetical protein ACFL96_16480 [Thermoproteota archaeon]
MKSQIITRAPDINTWRTDVKKIPILPEKTFEIGTTNRNIAARPTNIVTQTAVINNMRENICEDILYQPSKNSSYNSKKRRKRD